MSVPAPHLHDDADSVIFIHGFNASATVGEYVCHLLSHRPGLLGHVKQFSHRVKAEEIARYIDGVDGRITLIGNSLGAGCAAEVAVKSGRVNTLVTLAPVGFLGADYGRIAACVSNWIALRTPFGIADLAALVLSQGYFGPWGYGPEAYATTFIDSSLGHAQFWNQMDVACGFLCAAVA